ncbi:entericidin A/B family lipoprotein [Methylobacillus caricis]|nr:entericidin A/B family lipoprotein [Methylobacillus caricis]MCB5187218.1 entericidin A/B family lipoprotein [Methylobacillus caricis]
MKRRIAIIVFCLAALPLTACNTVHGVGKDIEKAGEAIQRSTK